VRYTGKKGEKLARPFYKERSGSGPANTTIRRPFEKPSPDMVERLLAEAGHDENSPAQHPVHSTERGEKRNTIRPVQRTRQVIWAVVSSKGGADQLTRGTNVGVEEGFEKRVTQEEGVRGSNSSQRRRRRNVSINEG